MTNDHITDIEAAMQDAARLNARVAELEKALRAVQNTATEQTDDHPAVLLGRIFDITRQALHRNPDASRITIRAV